MVKPGCEASVPGIDGSCVSDLSDFDTMFQQVIRATSRSVTTRQMLRSDPKGALVSPRSIWIEQLEPVGVGDTIALPRNRPRQRVAAKEGGVT
jgi:hypothetical protein